MGIVVVSGFILGSLFCLCCVFFVLGGFVPDFDVLSPFLLRNIFYYKVPGRHCARGRTGT